MKYFLYRSDAKLKMVISQIAIDGTKKKTVE